MYTQWFWTSWIQRRIDRTEYAQRFMDQLFELNIEYKLDTMVLEVSENKIVQAINSVDGYMIIEAKSIV